MKTVAISGKSGKGVKVYLVVFWEMIFFSFGFFTILSFFVWNRFYKASLKKCHELKFVKGGTRKSLIGKCFLFVFLKGLSWLFVLMFWGSN